MTCPYGMMPNVMLAKARADGVETAWDRLDQQTPHCRFCELGTTCRNCVMGPCRISAKAEPGRENFLAACAAQDADVIVARNFGRFIAGGSAGHSDHGRGRDRGSGGCGGRPRPWLSDSGRGQTAAYCRRAWRCHRRGAMPLMWPPMWWMPATAILAAGARRSTLFRGFPAKRRELWDKLDITPRGVDARNCRNDAPHPHGLR